ncbi:HvfC/BufC N-terminal domain-containing protein [Burkholderia catarinensis]|uniref:HvfC/BufC N-terminal domain-containing protein n=1 Tax=Burkholderia catarinensis TaxID=1108140 RepID=UPI0009133D7E|nr:DNA-binding domain-containing protein [Burkholderia catarinensis]KAG8151341.1 DUF2063 domain-containing protein [Burkholderia catarinensis]
MRPEHPEREYARPFAAGLTNPALAIHDDVVARPGNDVTRQYGIYRNNVIVSLIDALVAIYPAVHRITGDAFFRAMARFHVRQTPPTSPLLFEYGRDFPAFIESYAYAREMPWLADTARIERAWLDAYHAADLPVLSAQAFAGIEPTALAQIRFIVHPAAGIVRSAYPAVAIFSMNRTDGPVEPLCSSAREDALVTRPALDVMVATLPAGGATFLTKLVEHATLGEAAAAAFEEADAFDLPRNLSGMIDAGVFTAIDQRN